MNFVTNAMAWAVMVGGSAFLIFSGVLVLALLGRYTLDRMWCALRAGVSMLHLRQAIREWHVNHPELSAKWHNDKDD